MGDLSSRSERHLAFIVVDLGECSYGQSMGKLADVWEAIDSVEGCAVESFGSFPESERANITAYVEAAKAHQPRSGAAADAQWESSTITFGPGQIGDSGDA